MAPIEGSNRDLISADASEDYIEKLVLKTVKILDYDGYNLSIRTS